MSTAPTPETLTRHELCGLPVRVVAASDPGREGLAGWVVRETTRTLLVERVDGAVIRVPKRGTTFEFALVEGDASTDEAAGDLKAPGIASELPWDTAGTPGQSGGCEGVTYVTVDGDVLLARPARRTEHGADSKWR